MGKKIDTSFVIKNDKIKKRKIRMAYSLDNHQPVQCTMVSDQPFFYIDERPYEEDFFLDEDLSFEESFLESSIEDPSLINELLAMKGKIDAYDSIASAHQKENNKTLKEFTQNADNFGGLTKPDTVLDQISLLISKSRMAQALMDFATSKNITLKLSGETNNAYFDDAAKLILVNPQLSLDDMALLTMRELRRVWQTYQNANVNPLSFSPDEAVLVHRAQKADLDNAMVRFAWECRLSGASSLWSNLEHSEYQDLARSFAREALADFRTLNNGRASAVLFETWFLSERCIKADKDLINMMLSDYKEYHSPKNNSHNNYDILCRLGKQPFGKNYLSHYAHMIAADTLFTDVRDRSSANFLWFIKFERDFDRAEKIAEQQLQSIDTSKTSGDIHDLTDNQNVFKDTKNEKIHAFPVGRGNKSKLSGENPPAYRNNIVPLFFGDCGSNRSHT